MNKIARFRGLTAIALLRLSEADLRALHDQISSFNPSSFVELIRDIEDEIENSLSIVSEKSLESSSPNTEAAILFHEIDTLRKRELRIPVKPFADMLTEILIRSNPGTNDAVPQFDSRRGMQMWLEKLSKIFSPQEIYHAAMIISTNANGNRTTDWILR